MSHSILDLFHRRHACHHFHPGRTIPRQDLDTVLEAGRLSPSSFGMEPWKFIVLSGEDDKQALCAACFNQPQVGEASVVVVILARLADMDPDSGHVGRLIARDNPPEWRETARETYRRFHAATDVPAWSITQCHIAAANMMTAATALGLDSCAIGGFLADRVLTLLDADPRQYAVALVLPLGYGADDPGERRRLPFDEVVEYR